MIKPEAVAAGHAGKIIDMIIEQRLSQVIALEIHASFPGRGRQVFYAVHKERPFYGELVDYMASGPIYAAILEKNNAVEDYRKLIGATDPAQAEEGTIRKRFAESKAKNASPWQR
jgi:nucleoside-diphosphate kinase